MITADAMHCQRDHVAYLTERGLTQAALREVVQAPRLKALVLRVRGRASARLGDAGECARALDAAYDEVARPTNGPDGLTDYCTLSCIGMEAAGCWSQLGKFDTAVATFERSLPTWPEVLRRDRGLCCAMTPRAIDLDVGQRAAGGHPAHERLGCPLTTPAGHLRYRPSTSPYRPSAVCVGRRAR